METPARPNNEKDRLAALAQLEILDTPAEPSFDIITQLAVQLTGAPIAAIAFVDEHRQWCKSKIGSDAGQKPRDLSFAAHAINGHEVFVVRDTTLDPRFADHPLVTGPRHIRFFAGAPLLTAEGFALGTVGIMDTEPRPDFSAEEEAGLANLASMTMTQIELSRSLGFTDPLSGLPNRRQFYDDIEDLIGIAAPGTGPVVVAVDTAETDRYGDLIQTLGHMYSDAFTFASTRILRAVLPEGTTLYHLGNYSFAFVLSGQDTKVAEDLMDQVSNKLKEPIFCGPVPLRAEGCVGAARYPRDARSSLELVRAAISALHTARAHKAPWQWYDPARDQSYRRAFRLLSELPLALKDVSQLALHYQPKLDLRSGRCVGAEALLRWRHPALGMVPPGEFIALAERTELMRQLTDWVLTAAFDQLAAWAIRWPTLRLAVNISMHDLEDEGITERLTRLAGSREVSPDLVEIEITESALMRHPERARRQLEGIRAAGFGVAIDDFGTGLSSLFYIKHFPITVMKIDQVFIQSLMTDADDRFIVRTMLDLAHNLDCQVVAEGIESAETLNWLAGAGCESGQGYVISRPLEAAAFEAWMEGPSAPGNTRG